MDECSKSGHRWVKHGWYVRTDDTRIQRWRCTREGCGTTEIRDEGRHALIGMRAGRREMGDQPAFLCFWQELERRSLVGGLRLACGAAKVSQSTGSRWINSVLAQLYPTKKGPPIRSAVLPPQYAPDKLDARRKIFLKALLLWTKSRRFKAYRPDVPALERPWLSGGGRDGLSETEQRALWSESEAVWNALAEAHSVAGTVKGLRFPSWLSRYREPDDELEVFRSSWTQLRQTLIEEASETITNTFEIDYADGVIDWMLGRLTGDPEHAYVKLDEPDLAIPGLSRNLDLALKEADCADVTSARRWIKQFAMEFVAKKGVQRAAGSWVSSTDWDTLETFIRFQGGEATVLISTPQRVVGEGRIAADLPIRDRLVGPLRFDWRGEGWSKWRPRIPRDWFRWSGPAGPDVRIPGQNGPVTLALKRGRWIRWRSHQGLIPGLGLTAKERRSETEDDPFKWLESMLKRVP